MVSISLLKERAFAPIMFIPSLLGTRDWKKIRGFIDEEIFRYCTESIFNKESASFESNGFIKIILEKFLKKCYN